MQLERAARWWSENRPAAPNAIADDFEEAKMPWRTILMSAPTRSAILEISFMKLMRVASMALAAYCRR